MDLDGDGKLDLISGSYDPGELYLFRGLGEGKFAAREVIKDKSGKPILKVPNQKDRVESFGSWVTIVDWQDRGVLDILVGTFDGMMFVRRNLGTRTKLEYSPDNEWVMVGKKKLRVPGGAHANPVIVDWDGDGLWDIITGSADGGVYWYRNIGKKGQPLFAPPVALIPKHEGVGYAELLDANQQPKPGIRSQIAVTDFDGDGKLDILLGDFCTYLQIKNDLSPQQRKKFEDIRQQQEIVAKTLRSSMEDVQSKYKAMMKGVARSEWNSPENSKRWQQLYQGMRESASYKKTMSEYELLQKDLLQFVEKGESIIQNDPATPHGYVWLFRHK